MIQKIDKVSGKEYNKLTSLKRTSQETINKILEMYAQGRSQLYIEKELKTTKRTIRTILLEYGRIRDRAEQQSSHAHTFSSLREDAFDEISDDMAYWLGFLYADGYVTNPNGKKLFGVLLSDKDEGHLLKLKKWLGAPQKIYRNKTKIKGYDKEFGNVKLKIGSRKLYDKLREWGFTENKSYDAKPPVEMLDNRHFWRGVIDGDGYIGIINDSNKNCKIRRLNLCGTFDMCEGFKNFIIQNNIPTGTKIQKEVRKSDKFFSFYVASEIAQKVADLLYKDSKTYLDRKYNKYLEFLNQ